MAHAYPDTYPNCKDELRCSTNQRAICWIKDEVNYFTAWYTLQKDFSFLGEYSYCPKV